eukprot:4932655-Amphidinium_carterae.1
MNSGRSLVGIDGCQGNCVSSGVGCADTEVADTVTTSLSKGDEVLLIPFTADEWVGWTGSVSYTHLRAHETEADL